IYIPLQIAFVPIAFLGILLVAYRQMVVSKKLGVSQTAIEVLNGRWGMHVFGIRNDRASVKLAAALPNTSVIGLWLVLFPLWLKFKISKKLFLYPRVLAPGEESIGELVTARTLYFDRIIERVIGDIEQFVVMGAGYDTRAYGNYPREGLTFFELDQKNVQQHKRRGLDRAEIDSEHVRFVAVDFSNENAFDKLIDAGFERSRKTLFLWEGVSLYLSESDVRKTMQDVRSYAPAGSVLLADIYADRFVDIGKRSAVKKTLDYTDEGFGFSLPLATNYEEALLKFVESESMSVGETHFMGSTNDKGPFMVVAEMRW
ncbi:MAG: class I SAM-dependent methyltransferase, partial [Gammaproteobacteria bacterium]|nr:class I SAM-dependent methyltransferase [Gammaproteobacteria bacterium]